MSTAYQNLQSGNLYSTVETTSESRTLEEFLILIHSHLDKVPTLTAYVENSNLIPSTVFTSAVISKTAEALNGSVDLTSDCLIMSDLLRLYSSNFYGNIETFIAVITDIIKSGRTASGNAQPIYRSAVEDFYFQDIGQLSTFINDNELLVVIYVVTLISFIFNS